LKPAGCFFHKTAWLPIVLSQGPQHLRQGGCDTMANKDKGKKDEKKEKKGKKDKKDKK